MPGVRPTYDAAMTHRKTAIHALVNEFVPLLLIVAVATVLQRLTHHALTGTD